MAIKQMNKVIISCFQEFVNCQIKKTHLMNKWASGLEVLVEIFTCNDYILSINKCTSLNKKKKDSNESLFLID